MQACKCRCNPVNVSSEFVARWGLLGLPPKPSQGSMELDFSMGRLLLYSVRKVLIVKFPSLKHFLFLSSFSERIKYDEMFILADSTCYSSSRSMLKQQFFHFVFALNTVSSSSALLKNSQRALRPLYSRYHCEWRQSCWYLEMLSKRGLNKLVWRKSSGIWANQKQRNILNE